MGTMWAFVYDRNTGVGNEAATFNVGIQANEGSGWYIIYANPGQNVCGTAFGYQWTCGTTPTTPGYWLAIPLQPVPPSPPPPGGGGSSWCW